MAIRIGNSQIRQLYVGIGTEVSVADGNAIITGNVAIGATSANARLEVNVASGDGILIKSADVATFKMKGGGSVYDWGLANTNLVAHDFGIYKSNASGGDPISAGTAQLYFKNLSNNMTQIGIGSSGADVDGKLDVRMNMLGVNVVPNGTSAKWGEVWCDAGVPGTYFNDAMLHLNTNRGGGATGGIVGIAFSPGWGGHQNWGIYSFNTTGSSYTSGDLAFVSQINSGTKIERMRLNGITGNVGIGTDTPDEKLDVAGNVQVTGTSVTVVNASDPSVAVSSTDTNYKGLMVWRNSGSENVLEFVTRYGGTYYTKNLVLDRGKVGIGTYTPTAKLQIESTSAGAATVAAFLVNESVTVGTETRLAFAAHTNNDIATGRYSYISTVNTSGSNGQAMTFATNETGASAVERMRITSVGRIGIGEDNPSTLLSLKSSLNSSLGGISLIGNAAGDKSNIWTQDIYSKWLHTENSNDAPNGYGRIDFETNAALNLTYPNRGGFSFKTAGAGQFVTFTNTGRVGIGSTDPGYKLQVEGDTYITGRDFGKGRNMATSEGWTATSAGNVNSILGFFGGNFTRNGAANENEIVWDYNYTGQRALIWKSTNNDTGSNDDGGWNKNIITQSNDMGYMSVVYVKRTSSSTNGSFYFGCGGGNTLSLAGVANTNPYFLAQNVGIFPLDVWCCCIGFIQANNDSNTVANPEGGIYRLDTGSKIATSSAFKMSTASTFEQSHRTYLYYSTDPLSKLEWSDPGFYAIDGEQPSIGSLLQGSSNSDDAFWSANGNDIYNDNSGGVGIGISSTDSRLTVSNGTANNVANFKSSDGTAYIAISDSSSSSALGNQIGVVSDDMYFATADSEKMRILSGGDVIIGSDFLAGSRSLTLLSASNAVNYDINFKQTGTSNFGRIRFTEGAADFQIIPQVGQDPNLTLQYGGNSYFQRGNVGIGLTDPDSKLDINAGVLNITAGPAVRISKGGSPIGLIRYDTLVIEANDVATIRIGESDGTVSTIMSGDNNMRINSTDPIKFYTAGTTTGEGHGGQGGTFAMVIDNSQNVGICAVPEGNMVSYVKQLRIGEQSALQGHADGVGQDSATWVTTNYKFSTSGAQFINGTVAAPGYANVYQQQLGDHSFGCSTTTGVAGGTITERSQMVIKQSGNVGINNTSPGSKLNVSGDNNGTVQYSVTLGSVTNAGGQANSANVSPVNKTFLTGYSIPYSGNTNARLTTCGFLEFGSSSGWTGSQRIWAITSGYDIGGSDSGAGGNKMAIILGNAQNVSPQIGTNGSIGEVGDGEGANSLVACYWDNALNMRLADSSRLYTGNGGSAGLPMITPGTDKNTGIWYPTSDTWAISTGGSERFRITSTGDIGIGTTLPASKLEVSGRISGGQLGNPKITRQGLGLYVDFNDKACISGESGTEKPIDLGPSNYDLTLLGGVNFEYLNGIGTFYSDGNDDRIQVNNFVVADTSNSYEIWHYAVSQNGWETWWDSGNERPLLGTNGSSLRAYPNGTSFGTIDTGKWYHVVWAFASNNDLDIYINGVRVTEAFNWAQSQRTGTFNAWLGGDTAAETTDGYIAIARTYTRQLTPEDVLQNYNADVDVFATVTPPLGIVQTGVGVGIGTNNPQVSLQVETTTATARGTIRLKGPGGSKLGFWNATYPVGSINTTETGSMTFYTGTGVNGVTSSKVTILAGGEVGIGTMSPAAKLQVMGLTAVIDTAAELWIGSSLSGGDGGFVKWNNSTQNLYIGNSYNSAYNLNIVVANTGNVGIGAAPATDAKLEVHNGNLRVRGDQNAVIQLSNIAGNTKSQLGNAGNEGDLSLYTSANVKTVYLSSYYDSYINPAGGNVGIGDTSPSNKLDVNGDIRANAYKLRANFTNPTTTAATIYDQSGVGLTLSAHNISFRNYNGTAMMESARFVHDKLTVAGDVIAYGSPSDKRLKENIKPIESALDKAMKLQGVTFNWKKSDSILDIKEDIGFIAQDVKEVVPELVRENEDGMLSMRHQGIAPILLEAIKELKAEIDLLKSKPCTCNNCNCNI